jgi:hypothetical protein
MTNEKQQTAVKLIIAEIQRRVAIIQSEPQTMARELMIENLDVDLDRYEETERSNTQSLGKTQKVLWKYTNGNRFNNITTKHMEETNESK